LLVFALYCENNGFDGRSADRKSKHRGGDGDQADFNAGADKRKEKGFMNIPDSVEEGIVRVSIVAVMVKFYCL
jgi:hypothetical protein